MVQFPAIASFVFFPLYDVSLIITCGLIITSIIHVDEVALYGDESRLRIRT